MLWARFAEGPRSGPFCKAASGSGSGFANCASIQAGVRIDGGSSLVLPRPAKRKLLVALWKYVTSGVVIEGAVFSAACANKTYASPGPAGPGGSRCRTATRPWRYQPATRMVPSPGPRPPQAGLWCSHSERRPDVRLIGLYADRVTQRAQTMDLHSRGDHDIR